MSFTEENKDSLAVTHFTCDNVEMLQALKVTSTHVIIGIKELSLFGLIKTIIFPDYSVQSQVFLFLRPITIRQREKILDVHLLPLTIPVSEVLKQKVFAQTVRNVCMFFFHIWLSIVRCLWIVIKAHSKCLIQMQKIEPGPKFLWQTKISENKCVRSYFLTCWNIGLNVQWALQETNTYILGSMFVIKLFNYTLFTHIIGFKHIKYTVYFCIKMYWFHNLSCKFKNEM